MTEEEKKKIEENEEEVEATEEEPNKKPEEEEPEEVDYDQELEDRKKNRAHNKAGAETRLKAKGKLDTEKQGDVKEVIKEVLDEYRAQDNTAYVADLVNDELDTISNPSERKLVEDHYHNTIRQSGTDRRSIAKDISLARTLANQPRVTKENAELKIAAKNRANMSNDSQGANEDKPQESRKTKWTKEQLADFSKRGINPEDVAKTQQRISQK